MVSPHIGQGVREFLGFTVRLLAKDATFGLSPAFRQAFTDNEGHTLVLSFPVPTVPYMPDTDDSDYSVGGVLSQIIDDQDVNEDITQRVSPEPTEILHDKMITLKLWSPPWTISEVTFG